MNKSGIGAFLNTFTAGMARNQSINAQREEMILNKKLLDAKIKAMDIENEVKEKSLAEIMAYIQRQRGGGSAQPQPTPGGAGAFSFNPFELPPAGADTGGQPSPMPLPAAPALGGAPAAMPADGGAGDGGINLNDFVSSIEGQILMKQALGFVPQPEEASFREIAGPSGKPVLQAFKKSGLPIEGRSYAMPEKPETAQQRFSQSKDLRKEFTEISKTYRDVRDSFARIQESAEAPSAAGDLALIFNYMKMLDPGSTVREGEFANAQNSGGVPDIVRAQYNKLMSGERLSSTMRGDFLGRSEMLYNRQVDQYEQNKSEYTRLAEQLGVDPKEVIIDFGLVAKKKKGKPSLKMGGAKAAEEEAAAYMNGR